MQGRVLRPGHRAAAAAPRGLFGRALGVGEAPEAEVGQRVRGGVESRRGAAGGGLDHLHQGRHSASLQNR